VIDIPHETGVTKPKRYGKDHITWQQPSSCVFANSKQQIAMHLSLYISKSCDLPNSKLNQPATKCQTHKKCYESQGANNRNNNNNPQDSQLQINPDGPTLGFAPQTQGNLKRLFFS